MFEHSKELNMQEEIETFEVDENGYVEFGIVSGKLLGKQSQYGARYIDGNFPKEYPNLGEGLRINGNPNDYHSWRIHKDDIEEFVRRYNEYLKKERGL